MNPKGLLSPQKLFTDCDGAFLQFQDTDVKITFLIT